MRRTSLRLQVTLLIISPRPLPFAMWRRAVVATTLAPPLGVIVLILSRLLVGVISCWTIITRVLMRMTLPRLITGTRPGRAVRAAQSSDQLGTRGGGAAAWLRVALTKSATEISFELPPWSLLSSSAMLLGRLGGPRRGDSTLMTK